MEINGDPLPDVQHVYLLQTREFLKTRENIFKIGRTVREASERFREYSKSSKIFLAMVVRDCCKVEEDLKRAFDEKFHQRTDIGRESYQGDVIEMIKVFTTIVQADYATEAGNISVLSVATPGQLLFEDGILPFTPELIASRLTLYSPELIAKGQEGFKTFVLRMITFENGRNYKCLNKEKLVFSRLDSTGGWVKDSGAKFLNTIFSIRDLEGHTLLDRLYIRYAEIASKMRNADETERASIETEQETIRSMVQVCKVEKIIRGRFLKKVAEELSEIL